MKVPEKVWVRFHVRACFWNGCEVDGQPTGPCNRNGKEIPCPVVEYTRKRAPRQNSRGMTEGKKENAK